MLWHFGKCETWESEKERLATKPLLLFGNRSNVKDSHDRNANLEVGYLLQKIESYLGLVILASNVRQNIDPAFVRRLRHVVDLPWPPKRR